MTAFTATGTYAGRRRSVTWRDGRLAGDPVLILDAEAAVRAEAPTMLAGLWSGPAALDTHAAALATLTEVFDLEGVTPAIEGDEPEWEPVDPHATV